MRKNSSVIAKMKEALSPASAINVAEAVNVVVVVAEANAQKETLSSRGRRNAAIRNL